MQASIDRKIIQSAEQDNIIQAADDRKIIEAADDGILTKAVVDKNTTQTVSLDNDLEELDVEASQNVSNQRSQNMGQFKPNKESSNLGIAGKSRFTS